MTFLQSQYATPPSGGSSTAVAPRDRSSDRAVRDDIIAAAGARPIVIAGGTVLSQDPGIGNLTHADVLVRDGKIVEIGVNIADRVPDAIVVDASDAIVLPGFVDAHVHAWEGQLRGSVPTINFHDYIGLTAFGYGPIYSPYDNYIGTLLTAVVALDAGITTIIDNSHNSRTPDHSNAAVEALIDAGIRGVHASGIPFQTEVSTWPTDLTRLRSEYFASEDQLVTLRLFDAFPSDESWSFAKQHDLWMSHEMASHWNDLLPQLAEKGLLTAKHTFNHCIDLSDELWSLIVESGATINICPRSEPAFGSGGGYPPLEKLREYGIRPGLSGDNEVSYSLNPFLEMQTLMATDRAQIFARQFQGETDLPAHLEPADLLEFATLGGAVNADLDSKVGSLTVGKDADIILIRTTDLNTMPLNNAYATATAFAQTANVDTVFVAGALKKFRGELVGVDLNKLRGAVEESRDRIVSAAGRKVDIFAAQGASPNQ